MPHIVVLFMAMRSRSDVYKAGVISGVWTAMVMWGVITVGLIVRAIFETGEPWAQVLANKHETGLVVAAMHLLPSALAGLVLAAVLSAICSTADSQLVVAASAAANDLWARVFKRGSEASHAVINRLVVLGLGLGAVLLVIDKNVNVFEYILKYAWAMLCASFAPQLIILLFWKRASYAGCIAGMVSGFLAAVAWDPLYDYLGGGIKVYNLTVAFCLACVVNVTVSLLTPDSPRRPVRNEKPPRPATTGE